MVRENKPKGAEFILIEDDPADVTLIQEAFKSSRFNHHWHVFHQGEQALAYLRGQAAAWTHPGLILLDLNLPGMDGREVLAQLKADPRLKRLPVIVLTTSSAPADIRLAYERHANSYVTKPAHLNQLLVVAKRIEDYWLDTVQLPRV